MFKRMNRRELAGLATGGVTALSGAVPAWAQPAGTIAVRQTAEAKRFAEEAALQWEPAAGSANDAIVLDPSRTYQEVGAANSVRNWLKCIIVWNLVLDENGKPNIGPFNGRGLITIDSRTKEITRSGAYWAMKHYTHAARRGSKRFDSQGGAEGVAHVAFINPDGAKTLVLSNTGAARRMRLRLGGLMTEIALPSNSVTNLNWV